MTNLEIKEGPQRQLHTVCKKYGICIKSCWSGCQTGEPMKPEDMVEFGWPVDVARKHQAEFNT